MIEKKTVYLYALYLVTQLYYLRNVVAFLFGSSVVTCVPLLTVLHMDVFFLTDAKFVALNMAISPPWKSGNA